MQPYSGGWTEKKGAWLPAALLALCILAGTAGGGEIPQSEMQALDTAITREFNSNPNSFTFAELNKLKQRLIRMQAEARTSRPEKQAALEPLAADDALAGTLERLEAEAKKGGRAAQRTLALYYMYLNEPEKALQEWRRMGRATDYDIQYLLIAAYLEFALGEYNTGRDNLERALRFMDTRTSLSLSTPVLCQTIAGYRVYIPMPAGDILPGQEVLVYTEVEGAVFKDSQDGGAECDIMFGLRLKNESQSTLWAEPNYGAYAPVFAGPIRDLHVALTWRVPNDLPPGRYHLFVEAVEESTKRRGESVLGLNVGRRETNPLPRPTGGPTPPDTERMMREMNKHFPGAGMPEGLQNQWGNAKTKEGFEMLRRYEQMQGVR